MTTTVMRDSIVGDAWIQQVAQQCPVQRLVNKETGQPTGDYLTGPVRLSWISVFEPAKPRPGQTSEPKYQATLLFTPFVDTRPLFEEYNAILQRSFQSYYDARSGQFLGLESPFHDQAAKARFSGYTPGLLTINTKSKFKPAIIDARFNPIVDTKRVYPGVWAICSINAYPYGVNPPQPKKGVGFGLQSIMIIGDDTNIGEGGSDPRETFSGVNVSAPIVRPDFSQGMPTGQQQGLGVQAIQQPQGFMPQQPQGFAPQAQPQGFAPQAQPQGFMPGAPAQEDLSFLN